MIIGIACVDKNWAIGKKNKLLYHIKADMERFKDITNNGIVAMGYNTYLSLKRPHGLTNRTNIVLCNKNIKLPKDIIAIHSVDELLNYAVVCDIIHRELFIIGGGQLYKAMLPYYDALDITMIYNKEDKDADTFFPNLDKENRYSIVLRSGKLKEDDYEFEFLTYTNKEIVE